MTEWEHYAGRAGYVKNQGFYVYRGRRLIIYGTWFGLARQLELTKLARVRIDMPNEMDALWKIELKKASAQPPPQVKKRLQRIIETIGANSKRVYTKRGARLASDNSLPVWNRIQDKNEISYRVNLEHPVVSIFVADLPEDLHRGFERVLEIAGASLPVDSLYADFGNDPNSVNMSSTSDDALRHVAVTTYEHLIIVREFKRDDVIEMMRVTEPFRSNWERTKKILKEIETGADA